MRLTAEWILLQGLLHESDRDILSEHGRVEELNGRQPCDPRSEVSVASKQEWRLGERKHRRCYSDAAVVHLHLKTKERSGSDRSSEVEYHCNNPRLQVGSYAAVVLYLECEDASTNTPPEEKEQADRAVDTLTQVEHAPCTISKKKRARITFCLTDATTPQATVQHCAPCNTMPKHTRNEIIPTASA